VNLDLWQYPTIIDRPFSHKNMSPRNSAKNREIREKSMKKIMGAAFTLVAKQGYEATSISQIAAQAGVSKGLMYNYFEGKGDLLEKLVTTALDEGDKILQGLMGDAPGQTLQNIFEWFFKELRDRPGYWRLMAEFTFRIDKFPFVHDMATEKMKSYVDFIKGLLEQLGFPNPADEARVITALFDGIAIQHMVIKDDYPLREMERFLIGKYCNKKNSNIAT